MCAQSGQVTSGRALFRTNCAFCHGATAEGGRGPNLVAAPLRSGETDADIARVIREGVPGTTMPAFSEMPDDEVSAITSYLRTLQKGTVRKQGVSGDAKAGQAVYAKSGCAGCHRINGEGSIYGPDLSRIGGARSYEYLRESIIHPSADIPDDFEGVTAVRKDGKRVTGVRANEDTFTLQLRTAAQTYASFDKKDLREVVYEKKSLMPAYERMAASDLANLLAYLTTLRGSTSGTGRVKEAEGIH